MQLNSRSVNPLDVGRYSKKTLWKRDNLIPKIKPKWKKEQREKGQIETFGSHNTIILLFKEIPILIGRFPLPKGVKSNAEEPFGWNEIEKWVINDLFEGVTKGSENKQRHVDSQRKIIKNRKSKLQGIEIKYMNGHAEFAPTHVRSSYSQFDNLVSHEYLDQSGYIIVSKDYHRYKDKNKKNEQLLTVWFVPITNVKKWYYMYSNNISVHNKYMDAIKRLRPDKEDKINFYYKDIVHRIEGVKPSAMRTSTPGRRRRQIQTQNITPEINIRRIFQ